MAWLEISLSVDRTAVAAAEEALEALGALAVTLLDAADHAVLEPDPGSTPLWPVVQVRGLFEDSIDRQCVVGGLRGVPGADRPAHIRWCEVDDRDWERAWMDRFKPMRFGRRLWIVPGGMAIPPAPENVELSLAKRRRYFVLNNLDAGSIADDAIGLLDSADTADVQTDRAVELQGVATGCCLRAAKHHSDLHANLVDEDNCGAGLGDGTGKLAKSLAHQASVSTNVVITHVSLELVARGESGNRIDHN